VLFLVSLQLASVDAGGYFRVMARPSLDGGAARLGHWNLHGRLLNEGPWAALAVRMQLEQAAVHARIEGGSVARADAEGGALAAFRLAQLYVDAELASLTWQLGTLQAEQEDLSLYDMRPADLLGDTLGLSVRRRAGPWEVLVGFGDAGFSLAGHEYSMVVSGGARLRYLAQRWRASVGGQVRHEPKVEGHRYAPRTTPITSYADLVRGEVVENYRREHPNARFPRSSATDASSRVAAVALGFGGLPPLQWLNAFGRYERLHPDDYVDEPGERIYVRDYTDERRRTLVGAESYWRLAARVEAIWSLLAGRDRNADNQVLAGEDNRTFGSTVLRVQVALSDALQLLVENSVAREVSDRGKLWRLHYDSVFENDGGQAAARGLQYGDSDTRDTWQGKVGFVFSPNGLGLFSRPALRLVFGTQRSNVHNAFPGAFAATLDENDVFAETTDRHWHSVLSLEAEAWF
jgi:hypothetical protein